MAGGDARVTTTMASYDTIAMAAKTIFFFLLDSFKILQGFIRLLLCLCKREKERKKERKKAHLLYDTSLPHLVSLFLTPPIPALLVGKGVIAQTPSNNNTGSKRSPRTQNQEKSAAFNIKRRRVVFLELNYKERKENVMYVNDGRAIATVNI